MAGIENFQVVETKHKKVVDIFSENEAGLQPSKKTKRKQLRKHYGNITVKIEMIIPVRDVCMLNKTIWCTTPDKYR